MNVSGKVDLFAAFVFHDSADTDLAAAGFNVANPLEYTIWHAQNTFSSEKVTDREK